MATSFKELRVWQNAMDLAMDLFHLTKTFPVEERFSLTDQMRRSSRSIAANISEAWRKRRYVASFVSKLSDSEQEAAERKPGSSSRGAAATAATRLPSSSTIVLRRFYRNSEP